MGAYLAERGHKFTSETDTEVVAHLLEEFYQGDLFTTLLKILPLLKGAFALAIISQKKTEF